MKHLDLLEEAEHELKIAEQTIYITSSLLKDSKLFLVIIDHLHTSLTKIISSYLEMERMSGVRIPRSELLQIDLFLEKYQTLITKEELITIQKIRELKEVNKMHIISRGDKLFLLTDIFNLKEITEKLINESIINLRSLLERIKGKACGI